ncbi:hypothetical protein DMC30DRAFT_307815 [Rhodotorula diobovata]|uniref:Uncharacterized protein n=1 Tax=Rhodotorula diobovata TaxID=5288 RepID=A0A5C5FT24_9BASI|nr:hypothetical protein DMC30DRAFT_307815 [Rhodotorula diobovata]
MRARARTKPPFLSSLNGSPRCLIWIAPRPVTACRVQGATEAASLCTTHSLLAVRVRPSSALLSCPSGLMSGGQKSTSCPVSSANDAPPSVFISSRLPPSEGGLGPDRRTWPTIIADFRSGPSGEHRGLDKLDSGGSLQRLAQRGYHSTTERGLYPGRAGRGGAPGRLKRRQTPGR